MLARVVRSAPAARLAARQVPAMRAFASPPAGPEPTELESGAPAESSTRLLQPLPLNRWPPAHKTPRVPCAHESGPRCRGQRGLLCLPPDVLPNSLRPPT
eukprot:391955-Prymnesium_polylepis.1